MTARGLEVRRSHGPISCLLTGFLLCICVCLSAGENRPLETVVIGDQIFRLEVAADAEARQRGLMHRKELPFDRGMIFVFPAAEERGFWMKNTLIDLDIVYLDDEGRVLSSHRMLADPMRAGETDWGYEERLKHYQSGAPARFAIEFLAGVLDLLTLKKGDVVPLDLARLKRMASK